MPVPNTSSLPIGTFAGCAITSSTVPIDAVAFRVGCSTSCIDVVGLRNYGLVEAHEVSDTRCEALVYLRMVASI